MVTRSNANGVMYSEPIYSEPVDSDIERSGDDYVQPPLPVATDGDGHDWTAWERWLDQAIQRHLDSVARVVGYAISEQCAELRNRIKEQAKKIDSLQLELATMRGAVDTLRGRGIPGAFNIKGTYASGTIYNAFDTVALGNSSFIARRDNPGPCPGPDWQLLAGAGRRGPRGERGPMGMTGARGLNGLSAPTAAFWSVNRATYTATLRHVDGSMSPPLELRAMFQQFLSELIQARQ